MENETNKQNQKKSSSHTKAASWKDAFTNSVTACIHLSPLFISILLLYISATLLNYTLCAMKYIWCAVRIITVAFTFLPIKFYKFFMIVCSIDKSQRDLGGLRYSKLRVHRWTCPELRNLRFVYRAWKLHRKISHYTEIKKDYLLSFYGRQPYCKWYHKLDRVLIAILSPTRAFADFLKHVLPICTIPVILYPIHELRRRVWKARVLRAMNMAYRITSAILFIVTPFVYLFLDRFYSVFSGYFMGVISFFAYFTLILIAWYCLSRATEVFYAFVGDAIRIAHGHSSTSALTKADRIKLALWSYISLIVDFAIIYWIFRAGFITEGTHEPMFYWIGDALYFSGVTMATLGYGDIHPTLWVTKLLVIYQVACGISLLVLSFAIYVGDPGTTHHRNAQCKYPCRKLRRTTDRRTRWKG